MKNKTDIEEELDISYKRMKVKKERVALEKIKRNPKYFYKYANQFSKTQNRIGPLVNEEGLTVKDPFLMAEILRRQYQSTFSIPDESFNIENIGDLFRTEIDDQEEADEERNGQEEPKKKKDGQGEVENEKVGQGETEKEKVNQRDVEKEQADQGEAENVESGQRVAENEEPNQTEAEKEGTGNGEVENVTGRDQREAGPPTMYDAPFDYMDIIDAIDQLAECSGPGPDGIPAILLKKSKLTVALLMKNIFQNSLDSCEIPAILKLGFICPILKPNTKREKPASWRPVSLTSHVMKTMERVFRKQMVNHLEMN